MSLHPPVCGPDCREQGPCTQVKAVAALVGSEQLSENRNLLKI